MDTDLSRRKSIDSPLHDDKTSSIMRWMQNHYTLCIISYLLLALNSYMVLIYAEIIKRFVNILENKQVHQLRDAILLTLGILILHLTIAFFSKHSLIRFHKKLSYDIRRKYYNKLEKISMQKFEALSTGNLLTRYNNDIKELSAFIALELPSIISDGLLFVGTTVYFMNHNSLLLPIVIIPTLLIIPLFDHIGKRLMQANQEKMEALSRAMTVSENITKGLLDIKVNNAEETQQKEYESIHRVYGQKKYWTAKAQAQNTLMLALQYNLGLLMVLSVSGIFFYQGKMDLGSVAAFFMLYARFSGTIRKSCGYIAKFYTGMTYHHRLSEIMTMPEERKGGDNFHNMTHCHAVVIRDMGFSYEREEITLNYVNLVIKKGTKVAIVGKSGCGKSTIAKLISGYSDHYAGDIDVFGVPVKHADLSELRKRVVYIGNGHYLFSQSLLNVPDMEIKQMENLIKTLRLDNLFSKGKGTYLLPVGEDGVQVSGGQRQRLLLLQALLKDADIYIFDEMFSAVSKSMAEKICRYLMNTLSEKTMVFITHRPELLQDMDEVIYVDNGGICGCGKHNELMERNADYRLYMQFADAADNDLGDQ